MNEKDKEKTAFVYHSGLFELNVMPQIFSELMSIGLIGKESFSLAYLDDVPIFFENNNRS